MHHLSQKRGKIVETDGINLPDDKIIKNLKLDERYSTWVS